MLFGKKTAPPPLIKNVRSLEARKDFRIDAAGLALLAVLAAFAAAFRLLMGTLPPARDFGVILGTPVVTAAFMTMFPRWSAAVKFLLVFALVLAVWRSAESGLILAFAAAGALAAPAVQKMEEWERAIVLRFGRFHRVRGPGLFLLFPLADRVARVVDLRIRVTDFSAETTLTRDSVTVTVDALCFWLVWDPEKAICEVQNYEEAVVLSSKTALRNAISKNDLSVFLERGEEIEEQIRSEVDRKTTEWGITVQHIEITDIQIPESLQDSMSRLAQMEREKRGRVQLAEAEVDVAGRLKEAADIYGADKTAFKLKKLSVLYEGLKAGNSMMLVPSAVAEELKSKDVFGLQALTEIRRGGRKRGGGKSGPVEGAEKTDDGTATENSAGGEDEHEGG
jgi:regulator of protease activity HflC (stomatin/prohibitin superfamily)